MDLIGRPKLFIPHILGLLFFNTAVSFGLSSNILIGVVTGLYLVIAPGLLIRRLIKKNNGTGWEDVVYSVGLSCASYIILGLIFNTVLLYFNFRAPLTLVPLQIFYNVLILCLLGLNVIYKGDPSSDKSVTASAMSGVDKLLFITVSLLPILSAVGTSLLNNNRSNILVMADLIIIAIYILILGLFHKKLHKSLFPYSIYMIGLTVLFNISLRSWHINGTDILVEYRMFTHSLKNGYWSMSTERHAYNACLSITILPTILQRLTSIPSEYIFKFLMQVVFAFVPVSVYLFVKKFTDELKAFLAAVLYLSFPIFVTAMSMHIRQEVAFLFFSIIIYTIFDSNLSDSRKNFLLIVFGFSMIVSHYSTTYLSLALFSLWYFAYLLLRLLLTRLKGNTMFSRTFLHGKYVLLLFIMSFFWYVQVVDIGKSVNGFAQKVIGNISNTFSSDVRVDQTSLLNQFNLFYQRKNTKDLLDSYSKEKLTIAGHGDIFYDSASYKNYLPILASEQYLTPVISEATTTYVLTVMEVIKKVFKVMIFLGAALLFLTLIKGLRRSHELPHFFAQKELLVLITASLILIILFTIVPYATIDYDILRATQQLLGILVYPSVYAVFVIASRFSIKYLSTSVLVVFVVLYYSTYAHFALQLLGLGAPSMQLNNYGAAFERLSISQGEINSAVWLEKNKEKKALVHGNADSILRLNMSTRRVIHTVSNLMPANIIRYSYIYLNKYNTQKSVTYTQYKGEILRFVIPIWFYNANKDLIYNNGISHVYF